ncbi:class C beta-lactamase-related serine hydrolase [Henriciella barbarensis]|uniref:Class C beta-lactamase-related serine hydrolase n=1 Tax=Henriciella barbarensis TaxID=86342 RepID=A0A399QYB3_9PROT|nr:serine hydrolase [Henriciella barbarensis]RIJ23910.1 class C beta-lactamase-related serine hydrolase [Henriciella barbarensis]
MLFKSLLIAAACAVGLQASAQGLVPLPPQPDGVAWPTESWPEGEVPAGIDEELSLLVRDAMATSVTEPMGQTRAIIIIHEGRLISESYADGFGPDTKQVSWSMAKSITSALVGRAVEIGLIEDIDYVMPTPFPEGDPRGEITWRQWLTMTDGLDYLEIGSTGLADNDVVQMMYGPGRFDVAQHIVDEFELAHDPGAVWNYSTAGFHLISWALQKLHEDTLHCSHLPHGECAEAMGLYERKAWARDLHAYLLFDQIGMDAQPEFDAAGTFLGGSLVWASARDFAKFGYLYLRDGVWEGERLLPEGWVDFSRRNPVSTKVNVYGAGWWLGADPAPEPAGQAATTPPFDAFSAQGHEGQTIWIVPSKDLVIVRLGLMPNGGDNWPRLYEWNQSVARLFPDVPNQEVSSAEGEG